jgi:hypothetical protein
VHRTLYAQHDGDDSQNGAMFISGEFGMSSSGVDNKRLKIEICTFFAVKPDLA